VNGQESKFAKPRKKVDPYETAILDFLDKEIEATRSSPGERSQPDDVDALVSDLLKQAIAASDSPESSEDNGADELDAIVSGILGNSDENGPSVSSGSASADPDVNRNLRLISQVQAPPAAIPARKSRSQTADGAGSESLTALQHAILNETPPAVAAATPADKPHHPGIAATRSMPDSPAVFSHLSLGPSLLRRPFVAASIFAVVVVAVGAGVYFVGFHTTEPMAAAGAVAATVPAVEAPAQVNPSAGLQPSEPLEAAASEEIGRPAEPAASSSQRPAPEGARVVPPTPDLARPSPPPPVPDAQAVKASPTDVANQMTAASTPVVDAAPIVVNSDSRTSNPEPPPSNTVSVLGLPQSPGAPLALAASPRRGGDLGKYARVPNSAQAAPAVVPAMVLSKVAPEYPELARRNRFTGTVDLVIQIDAQGHVASASAWNGPALLRQAAVDAVKKWKYRPATRSGVPVPSQARVAVVFNN
jgi:protein TonB